jgi:hypothetical protein
MYTCPRRAVPLAAPRTSLLRFDNENKVHDAGIGANDVVSRPSRFPSRRRVSHLRCGVGGAQPAICPRPIEHPHTSIENELNGLQICLTLLFQNSKTPYKVHLSEGWNMLEYPEGTSGGPGLRSNA